MATKQTKCPICERVCADTADVQRFRPFCSQRCQQVDLMRWMKGQYAVVEELDPDALGQDEEFGEADRETP